jgi:uncharacterized protein
MANRNKRSIDHIQPSTTLWESFRQLRAAGMTLTNEQLPENQAFMPCWDLFWQLRRAGMNLTIEDYEQLRRSIASGFGLADWPDLEDICRFLWVKPSLNYDAQVFEREFAQYRSNQGDRLSNLWQGSQTDDNQQGEQNPTDLTLTPPPRKRPPPDAANQPSGSPTTINKHTNRLAADAVKDLPSANQNQETRFTIKTPIDVALLQRSAANLPRSLPNWHWPELDVEATVEKIGREGIFGAEVLRPLTQKKVNLLLLVDDSNAMRPFAPVVEPFVQMMMQLGKRQSLIYRFNQYPGDYLYQWQRPLWGLPLAEVAKTWSKQRTMVVIISDAGAISPIYQEEYVSGVGSFLDRLLPAVRDVLWVNPLPPERWPGTSAEPIEAALAGRMIFLEPANWQRLTRTKQFRAKVQLTSLGSIEEQEFDDDDW